MSEDTKTISTDAETSADSVTSPERRKFLLNAGKFAAVATPAVTVLLSTSMQADASALWKSGGKTKYKKHSHKKWKQKKAFLKKLFSHFS